MIPQVVKTESAAAAEEQPLDGCFMAAAGSAIRPCRHAAASRPFESDYFAADSSEIAFSRASWLAFSWASSSGT
jgi:hypothetical protein